ncbi:restriction endonuclease subunit S [Streptomyces sp. SID1143]|uniref:restriction endonuclease subunit S n=1 Tax=Streptomyces sp. SID1143 TaxID=3425889 RepID=UPI0040567C3D
MSGIAEGEDAGALPEGWVWARLGEVLSEPLINGRSVRTKENGFPVLRLTSLKPDGVDFGEAKLGAWTEEEAEPYLVTEGDFLLSRGNGSLKLVGRGSLVRAITDPVAFPDTMIRVRTETKLLDSQFLSHLWNSPLIRTQIERAARTTAGIYKINQGILADIHIPLPPLAEQHRIVETLEVHLSRLDAAVSAVERSARRSEQVWKAALNSVAQGRPARNTEAEYRTVGSVSDVSGGIQKQKKRLPLNNIYPFLRVANIARGALDLSEIHQIELFDGELDRHKLEPGDLLVVEGNGSPDQIGRAATWHGEIPDTVHQNHLIRVRPGPSIVPRYLELVWNAPVVIDQLRQVARSTSGLYTLSTSKVKSVRIPVPTPEEQQRLAAWADELESHNEAAKRVLEQVRLKNQSLKQSLLHQAFTGRLVPQDPDDEPASVLLARIKAERAAQAAAKPKRARGAGTGTKTKRSVPTARTRTTGPPPAAASAPLPANAVQPTFDVFEDQTTGRHQAPDQDETQDAAK